MSEQPATYITEAEASVRLDHDKTQSNPLDVLIAGCDDDELSERASAHLEELEARLAAAEQLIAFLQDMIHSAAGNMTAADAKIRKWKEAK
jgi:hypothetical protein